MGLILFLIMLQPRVLIEPSSILLAPGDTVKISAILLTEKGEEIQPKYIEWKVVPRNLGKVEEGVFSAFNPGIGVIKAKVEYKNKLWVGNAYVEINPKRRLRILIRPKRIKLDPGEEVKFKVESPIETPIQWKVIPQWLGKIENGKFTAGDRKGAGQVIAIVKTEEARGFGTAQIVVGTPEEFELRVRIDPPLVVLSQNEEIKFKYSIEDKKMENIKLTWWIEPSFLGEIKEDGTLRINVPRGRGAVWLLAEAQDKVGLGRAILIVAPPHEKPEININPPLLILDPGEISPLEIQLKNIPIGKIRERKPKISWKVRPQRLGFIKGKGPKVIFRAGREPGIGAVILEIERRKAKRRLTTAIPVLVGRNRLTISPIDVTLSPGDTVKFRLRGSEGLISEVRWIVRPGNGGEIREDGTFTPTGASPKVYVIAALPDKVGGGGAIALVRVVRIQRP